MYYITIGNNEYNVNLEGKALKLNGKPVSANLRALNGLGLHVLQRDRKAIEMYMNSRDADNLEILVGGRCVVARVETSQKRAGRREVKEEIGSVIAPMPGMVVSVLVKPGDTVEQGQTVAVLESMKMQMQLRSAIAGSVISVLHQAGDQVEKGKEILRVK
jgi:biotin carboxyl carrier protein